MRRGDVHTADLDHKFGQGNRRGGYNSLEILLKVDPTFFPRVITALMMITDINAAISAYSMEVTALWSWICKLTRTHTYLIKSANMNLI